MSSVRKSDVFGVMILAFNFLVAGPALEYPLWAVHSRWFRASLLVVTWGGLISALALPIWIGIRLFREPSGRLLKVVEFLGALGWIVVLGHQIVSDFPVI
jgi:hypothetical protein